MPPQPGPSQPAPSPSPSCSSASSSSPAAEPRKVINNAHILVWKNEKLGCLYVVPFLRYSEAKNGVTLKLGVAVVQGHWKWCHSVDRIGLYWLAIVSIALSGAIFRVIWRWIISCPWNWGRGHSVSLKLVPLESLGAVSYSPSIVTMAVSVAVCEIFSVKEWRDLVNQVRGLSTSLKMAPLDRPYATFYWLDIVNMALYWKVPFSSF